MEARSSAPYRNWLNSSGMAEINHPACRNFSLRSEFLSLKASAGNKG